MYLVIEAYILMKNVTKEVGTPSASISMAETDGINLSKALDLSNLAPMMGLEAVLASSRVS